MTVKKFFLLIISIYLLNSCDFIDKYFGQEEQKEEPEKVEEGVEVKKVYLQGKLASETPYKNGKKHGISKNYYYQRTGKLAYTISFQNGVKQGESVWYYESGKIYRVSPYKDGKLYGIQKIYYENGQLKAEVPYKKGEVTMGLKEYTKTGELVTGYPKILFKEIDKTAFEDNVILQFYLSDKSENVEYFRLVTSGKDTIKADIFPKKGIGKITFYIPRGAYIIDKVNILAKVTTSYNNTYLTKASYNFAFERAY